MKDLIGNKFGRLTIVSFSHKDKNWFKFFKCLCSCGNEKIICINSLKAGNTKSCGCLQKENLTVHGLTNHLLYQRLYLARDRCTNPLNPAYENYGGRGIKFKIIFSKECFDNLMIELGDRSTLRHSLDRKNNDGHYESGNLRWATPKEQSENRRELKKGKNKYVYLNKKNRWEVRIPFSKIKSKVIRLGSYDNEIEANEIIKLYKELLNDIENT